MGDQDSLYAELYSFIASLEVLYSVIAQLKIVPHTTFHFLTDSKEARYLLLSKAPPEKYAQLVLFIRQNLKTILKNFCYKIHWIPGHAEIGVHDRTHCCARVAATCFNNIPKFPPKFEVSVFARDSPFYVIPPYGQGKQMSPNEIFPSAMGGNMSLLITKFFINYLISNPQTIPKIQQTWFDHFGRSSYAAPPPWEDNHLLVTALRTPYVVTHHLPSTPSNALGWAYHHNNPELPEFGFFKPGSACNQLFLYALTEHELIFLNKKIEQELQQNKADPWRIAFFISEKEKSHLREFPDTISSKIATFSVGPTTIHLQCIQNKIASKLDTIMHHKLITWGHQFQQYQIHIKPTFPSPPRRSIQSYFQPELPPQSTILSQSYMKYLQPQPSQPTPNIDPTINLIGFHPHFKRHISELENGNKFMHQLYKHHSYKYDKIKKTLAS